MRVISSGTLYSPKETLQEHVPLSGIDMSPLLLTCVNSPALFFDQALDVALLTPALSQLLALYPLLSGRQAYK